MANSIYVVSDLHGDYDGFVRILEKIQFSDSDAMYVNGDVLDRGQGGLKILQHMMLEPNIYPIIGNHEYAACQVLQFVNQEITDDFLERMDAGMLEGILEWQNIGGQATLDEFHNLTPAEREDIIEYLQEFAAYEEVNVNGNTFVIVHAGLDHFDPNRALDDYDLHELIFQSPDYETVYFPDKYLITGHLPTRAIEGASPDKIYKANNHIAIDCGAGFGGQIGCICLNTMEEYYSKDSFIST